MTTRRGFVPESGRRYHQAQQKAERAGRRVESTSDERWPPRKEEAECCLALRDSEGRLRPGFCGPACIRRPENWRRIVREAKRQPSAP